jgi:selenocysteine lyase/cysteine desulfurase
VRYALELGLEPIRARVAMLADRLRASLAELPGIAVQDLGKVRSGIVTFTKEGEQPRDIQARLRAANVGVSVSSRSSAQLDFGRRGLTQVVRSSVHYFNTEEEIATFCKVLGSLR